MLSQNPIGFAIANQTVERFDISVTDGEVNKLTNLCLVKVKLGLDGGNFAVLEATEILNTALNFYFDVPTQAYVYRNSFTSVDFSVTSIDEGDLIYAFFGASTVNDISPIWFNLKCSID